MGTIFQAEEKLPTEISITEENEKNFGDVQKCWFCDHQFC